MSKTLLIASLLAVASLNSALAAVEAVPVRRTTAPAVSFEQVLKNIAFEIAGCKRLHGVMTTITSATMKGDSMEVKGNVNGGIVDNYRMKVAPTKEQLKSLIGKPVCDPN
ncbi:MAG: hypothetical protein D4R84_15595 [Rhodocyclaceae bacterium]|nr:MAG: hypothetical protein D4R84_15595 [Rhodocyclaceae bacterium]